MIKQPESYFLVVFVVVVKNLSRIIDFYDLSPSKINEDV
jgi:hypothetical protein